MTKENIQIWCDQNNYALIEKETKDGITADKIIQATCEHFHITKEKLLANNKSRDKEFCTPRQIIMYAMKVEFWPKKTLFWIGSFFDKHHATVIHSVKSVEEWRETDKYYRRETNELFDKIGILDKVCNK